MGISKAKKDRLKAIREGKPDPADIRLNWQRKPMTQVQPNTKAQQRRSQCRHKGSRDGADLLSSIFIFSFDDTERLQAHKPLPSPSDLWQLPPTGRAHRVFPSA